MTHTSTLFWLITLTLFTFACQAPPAEDAAEQHGCDERAQTVCERRYHNTLDEMGITELEAKLAATQEPPPPITCPHDTTLQSSPSEDPAGTRYTCAFDDGQLNGPFTVHTADGDPIVEGMYRFGKKVYAITRHPGPSHAPKYLHFFDPDGRLHGAQRTLSELGAEVHACMFEHGAYTGEDPACEAIAAMHPGPPAEQE